MKTATQTEAIGLIDLEPTAADFRAEVRAGLRGRPKTLPCKFFYDARGSQLFDQICALPEYYPTRTETRILSSNRAAIAAACGPRCRLVELGSGSSVKTRQLLDALEEPAAYVPIDISRPHLLQAARGLADDYPQLEILPVCADFAQPVPLPEPRQSMGRTVLFFPGSTIGNFEPTEAIDFLRNIRAWGEEGDRLLIGVDHEKERTVLERAYNDAQGITAAFNLNLLQRANDELGANFDLQRFAHQAIYEPSHRRIEMHLVSLARQRVVLGGEVFAFAKGERIITEYSYKHRPADFIGLARKAGWELCSQWTDTRGWFGVYLLERGADVRSA